MAFLTPLETRAQVCSRLLKPDYSTYDLSVLKRPNAQISDNLRSRSFLMQLDREGAIIPSTYSPYSREQCYGTCYAYASITVLENRLIQDGAIEEGALVLAPGILTHVARERINSGNASVNFSELLDAGTIDVFHALHGHTIQYIPVDELRRLGPLTESSDTVLDLESSFLITSLERLSEPEAFSQRPLVHSGMAEIINDGFVSYIHTYAQEEEDSPLNYRSVGPISMTYEVRALQQVVENDQTYSFILDSTINTDLITTAVQAESTFWDVSIEDRSARNVRQNAFDEISIREIVTQLQENNFIFVGLKSGIFGGAHAVTLTNLVINPVSRAIMGFVFLDSNHRNQGALGYRFISVRELQENMSVYAFITELRID